MDVLVHQALRSVAGLGLASHRTVLDSVSEIAPSVLADGTVVLAQDGTRDFTVVRTQRVALVHLGWISVRLAESAEA